MIPVTIIMSVLLVALALNSFRLCGKVEGAEAKSKALQSDLRDMDVVRASMEGRLLDKGVEARRFKDDLAEARAELDKARMNLQNETERADGYKAKLKTAQDECSMWRGQYQATRDACDAIAKTSQLAHLKAQLDRDPSAEAAQMIDAAMRKKRDDAPCPEVEPSVVGQVAHDRMRGETR